MGFPIGTTYCNLIGQCRLSQDCIGWSWLSVPETAGVHCAEVYRGTAGKSLVRVESDQEGSGYFRAEEGEEK